MTQYALSCLDYVYATDAQDVQPDFMYAIDGFNMSIAGDHAEAAQLLGSLASDNVYMSYTLLFDLYRTALAESTVGASDVYLSAAIFRPTILEEMGLSDSVTISQLITIAETVGLTDNLTSVRALAVLEALGLADVLVDTAKFGSTVADVLRLADTLARFFSGDVVENLTISEALTRDWRGFESMTDQVALAETMTGGLVLRITADEAVHMSDAQLLKFIYDAKVLDNVELTAVYAAPNGDTTVWNINVVTGSVSQYDNYAFNSFARFGQKFIGADENGLYELDGSSDDGLAIVPTIRSGLTQFTASRYTMIRDAYIGMRSNGSFILRVITGEGDSYDYCFDAQDMHTTRVPLGKGMRARYVAFELIGDGEDFDLESVEFIPLSSTRRV